MADNKVNLENDPDLADFEPVEAKPAAKPSAQDELRAEIAALKAQLQEQTDKVMRAHAEVENIRRRNERELVQAHKYGLERMAQELLPVVDNLERALEQKIEGNSETLRTGVELTLKLFQSLLEKFAIKAINPVNAVFDPTLHEAMSMVEAEVPAGTVVTVLQKGYQLHDRLLRPALVTVAKATEKANTNP